MDASHQALLLISGGALLFSAGLLQLVTWRITRRPVHGVSGCGLGALGLAIAFTAQLAPSWLVGTVPVFDVVAVLPVLLAASALASFGIALAAFLRVAADEEEQLASAEQALHAATLAAASYDRAQRDLRHDARNALCALRMATQTLAEVGDRLNPETRQRLRVAVLEETRHLDQLISRPKTPPPGALGVATERTPPPAVPAQRRSAHQERSDVSA